MRLRFLLLLMLVATGLKAAIPVYKPVTLSILPIELLRSNLLDSGTLTWTMDGDGRMTPNVIGGASSNAQPPSANLTNWSTIATQALRVAKTVFVRTNGNDATGAREWTHLPFATHSNALAVLQPGDVMMTGPGTFPLTTTIALSNNTAFIGAGRTKTRIIIQADSGGFTVGTSNYMTGFDLVVTNCGSAIVPISGTSCTNAVFEDLAIDAFYDGFIFTGNGAVSVQMRNVSVTTAFDCLNAAAVTNDLARITLFNCDFRADYTKCGTAPQDTRALYALNTKIVAIGCTFEALNLASATAIDLVPNPTNPPVFIGCRIYSNIGEAVGSQVDIYDEVDPFTPIHSTNLVMVFDGCDIEGRVTGPLWGTGSGLNNTWVGAANWITNAYRAVVSGNSNYTAHTTNALIYGKTLTNNISNSLDIGVADATKSTWSATNSNHRAPMNVAGTVSLTNLIVTNRVIHAVRALTYSGTNVTVDWSQGIHWYLLMTNNAKLWFTNAPGLNWGETGLIDFEQDGTGSRLLYWDTTNIRTNPANPVVLTTAASGIDDMHVKTYGLTGTNFHILLNTGWAK